jgi:hypothetical protein
MDRLGPKHKKQQKPRRDMRNLFLAIFLFSLPILTFANERSFYPEQFALNGEWLYLRAEQDNLEYGRLTDGKTSHAVKPNNKFSNSFRVKLDTDLSNTWLSNTVLGMTYTNLSGRAHNAVGAKAGQEIRFSDPKNATPNKFSALQNEDLSHSWSKARSKWHLQNHVADLSLKQNVSLTPGFTFIPQFGVRNYWMRQNYEIHTKALVSYAQANMKQNMYAVGPQAGLGAEFLIGKGLSFKGSFTLSALYANHRIHTNVKSRIDGSSTDSKSNDRLTQCMPMLDYFLGLQYTSVYNDSYPVDIRAGWEQHYLFDANQMASSQGNLSFSGITLGMNVGF